MQEQADFLRTQLVHLEAWQQLTFAAAIVQRMAPNFVLFAELVAEQDEANQSGEQPVQAWPKTYGSVLSLVWEYCSGVNSQIDFHKQLAKVEAITPDPKAYDFYGVWPALDAVAALSALVSCAEKLDNDELMQIFELSSATIHGYLEAIGQAEDEEQQGEQHQLLLAEAAFSEQLLAQITATSKAVSRRDQVTDLRRWIQDAGVSNIGIAL